MIVTVLRIWSLSSFQEGSVPLHKLLLEMLETWRRMVPPPPPPPHHHPVLVSATSWPQPSPPEAVSTHSVQPPRVMGLGRSVSSSVESKFSFYIRVLNTLRYLMSSPTIDAILRKITPEFSLQTVVKCSHRSILKMFLYKYDTGTYIVLDVFG